MPADPARADDLLRAALALPAEQRPAFLDAASQADAELRRHLEQRLQAHDRPEGPRRPGATSAWAGSPDLPCPPASAPAPVWAPTSCSSSWARAAWAPSG
jgi:hypothetical protein